MGRPRVLAFAALFLLPVSMTAGQLGQTPYPTVGPPPASEPTLQAAVSEIRGLRVTMEGSQRLATSVLVLGQQHLAREIALGALSRQLQDARLRLLESAAARREHAAVLAELGRQVGQSLSASAREAAQRDVVIAKIRLGSAGTLEQELRQREGELAREVERAQTAVNESAARLSALARSLAPAPPPQ